MSSPAFILTLFEFYLDTECQWSHRAGLTWADVWSLISPTIFSRWLMEAFNFNSTHVDQIWRREIWIWRIYRNFVKLVFLTMIKNKTTLRWTMDVLDICKWWVISKDVRIYYRCDLNICGISLSLCYDTCNITSYLHLVTVPVSRAGPWARPLYLFLHLVSLLEYLLVLWNTFTPHTLRSCR